MTNINDDSFDMNDLKNSVLNDESDITDNETIDIEKDICNAKVSPMNLSRDTYSGDDDERYEKENNTVNNNSNSTDFSSSSLNPYNDENTVSIDSDSDNIIENIWEYRNGFAYNETQREYEMLRFFLTLGRGRSVVYLSRIYSLSVPYIKKVSLKNNWLERIEAYDRQTLSNALSEENNTRRKIHEEKLEIYRSQQETIANQSADNASKILHLIQRKLDKIVNDTQDLTIDELVSTGSLAVKLSQLQKELGSQALAVDALLEAIETDD